MKNQYFLGYKVSDYGLEHGRVDYATLAKTFDAVLNNDIIKNTIDIGYWEQEQGFNDYNDEIEELEKQIEEIELLISDLIEELEDYETDTQYIDALEKKKELEEKIEEFRESERDMEIFHYYIISDNGARILEQYTNEIVFYNDVLDMYVWGVTHFGTSWDYVLTDIELN